MKMQSLLIFCILMFVGSHVQAQNGKIEFDSNANAIFPVKPMNGVEIKAPKKWETGFYGADLIPLMKNKWASDSTNIRKGLLKQIEATISNMDDERLKLKAQYEVIFGKGVFDQIRAELINLKYYLDNNKISDRSLIHYHTPNPLDIDTLLMGDKFISIKSDDLRAGFGYERIRLLQNDQFKIWLAKRFDFQKQSMDLWSKQSFLDYKQAWRQLELMPDTLKALVLKAKEFCDSPNVCSNDEVAFKELRSRFDKISQGFDKNLIVQSLNNRIYRQSNLVLSWLWYNGGHIRMNPLGYKNGDLFYGFDEPNRYLDSTRKKQLEKLYGDEFQKGLVKKGTILNEVWLPAKSKPDKQALYFAYDAQQLAPQDNHEKQKVQAGLPAGSNVDIIVYNVSKNEPVNIELNTPVIKDESRLTETVGDIAGQIGGAVSLLSPALGTMAAVTGLFNRNATVFPNSSLIGYIPGSVGGSVAGLYQDSLFEISWKDGSNYQNGSNNTVKVTSRGGMVLDVPLSYEQPVDKERILFAHLRCVCEGKHITSCGCDMDALMLVGPFIKQDFCCDLDYANVDTSASLLIMRFEEFLSIYKKRETDCKTLENDINVLLQKLDKFLLIYDRSLPPAKIEEKLKAYDPTDATLITMVKQAHAAEDGKALAFKITKKLSKVKDEESVVPPLVAVQSNVIRVGKPKSFSVSAGIAYTMEDYLIFSQSGTALPTASNADRLRFSVMLHWYPWKILNVDDNFCPKRGLERRFSLLAGFSIPKSLENFYFGGGYDIVPGLVLSGGIHLPWVTRYEVVNNQVVKQAGGFREPIPFISIGVKPSALVSVLNVFSK